MTAPTGSREEPGKEAEESSSGGGLFFKVVVGRGLLALVIFLGRSAGAYVPRFAEWVGGLGPLGPTVFILGYAAAVVTTGVAAGMIAAHAGPAPRLALFFPAALSFGYIESGRVGL